MTVLTVSDLTQTTLDGTGVFDALMRANKAHLDAEFAKERIKGSEYATVYLGSLSTVLQASLQFLLQKDELALKADLLAQQIILAGVEVQKAQAELAIMQANVLKIPAEIAQLTAQTAVAVQQASNLVLDAANIPKQGAVLVAQECKLRAEFDLITSDKLKSGAEVALLTQKNATEKAQTTALGVDDNSVIGKQKLLYGAQTAGYSRDAEQKAAKLMIDTWNVRRTSDPTTADVNANNLLTDPEIGKVVGKMLTGVGV